MFIEAPFPYRRGFQWYLFYSGNDYGSPAYAVSYATAADIKGVPARLQHAA